MAVGFILPANERPLMFSLDCLLASFTPVLLLRN
jgi:hypothetical protein